MGTAFWSVPIFISYSPPANKQFISFFREEKIFSYHALRKHICKRNIKGIKQMFIINYRYVSSG